jgi:glycosyltransferase involved in cell wall biosynthesis
MNPKVSVIVPIYNAEKYMKKCIDSILSQTLKNIEIILVNDGSSDNSANIADEYSRLDKRVRVIHQNNSGPSKNNSN